MEFVDWLQSEIPPDTKALKLMTMIRDPMDRIASGFHDHICEMELRLNNAAERLNIRRQEEPCLESTFPSLAALADEWLTHFITPRCRNDPESLKGSYQYLHCPKLPQTNTTPTPKDDPLPHCRSIPAFLNSSEYEEEHNWFTRLMMPQMETRTKSSEDDSDDDATTSVMEIKALRQLGGLSSEDRGAHMLWFGITERMKESICLLHYTLRLPYVEITPRDRYVSCRPTHWFAKDDHRNFLRSKEVMDYIIHKAANAIMDIRMNQMCTEIQTIKTDKRPSYIPDFCCTQHD
jgi:hypothetical protein